MSARYAIYYCPSPDSAVWRLGSTWLGRDAATGAQVALPMTKELSLGDIKAAVTTPSLYGFHATLFAPFELERSQTESTLCNAVADFCRLQTSFSVQLEVRRLKHFIALSPVVPEPLLDTLAATCVQTFERFRAPLSAHDEARRNTPDLTPMQREHLARWGYPHVFDAFQCKRSLSGVLPFSREALNNGS